MTPLLRTLTALLLAITVVAPSAYLGMQPVRTAEATCGLATAIAALFGIAGTAAEATLAVPVFPFTTNINTGSTAASTWENTIKECVIDTIFWIIKEVVIKSITKSIISWIRGGFKGSPAFVTDPHAFFKGVMLNTVSAFLFNEGLDKLLCSPFRIDIIFSFAFDVFGQKNNLGMLSCSLDKVFSKGVEVNVQGEVDFGNKYKKFVGGNFHFAEGGIPALMAMTNDMNNPYGTYFSLQSEAAKRSGAAQSYEVNLTNWGKGWLSQRCDMDGDSKTNDDEYTCTPGEYISEQVNKWSGGALEELTVADELGEIINALLAALVEKVLTTAQEGLLGLGSGGKDTDYWNAAMAATSTDWQTHPGAEGWEGEIVKPTPPPTPPGGGGEQDCGVHIFDCFESAGPTEVLAASFNDITTGRTAATYSGYVRVRVTGAGSGSHAAFSENDAFYYTVTRELLESSTPPSHAGAHLSYSTTTSYRSGGVPIKTYILFVEGVGFTTVTPEYSSENDYEFVIYVGDQARALRIGTGIEQGEVPNAGVFTVEVEPLTMKETPPPPPPPPQDGPSMVICGFGDTIHSEEYRNPFLVWISDVLVAWYRAQGDPITCENIESQAGDEYVFGADYWTSSNPDVITLSFATDLEHCLGGLYRNASRCLVGIQSTASAGAVHWSPPEQGGSSVITVSYKNASTNITARLAEAGDCPPFQAWNGSTCARPTPESAGSLVLCGSSALQLQPSKVVMLGVGSNGMLRGYYRGPGSPTPLTCDGIENHGPDVTVYMPGHTLTNSDPLVVSYENVPENPSHPGPVDGDIRGLQPGSSLFTLTYHNLIAHASVMVEGDQQDGPGTCTGSIPPHALLYDGDSVVPSQDQTQAYHYHVPNTSEPCEYYCAAGYRLAADGMHCESILPVGAP